MRVLMLGWEFPPFIAGGLGTACYGLTRALSQQDTRVTFVLPKSVGTEYTEHVRLLTPQAPAASAGSRAPEAVASTYEPELPDRDRSAFENVTFKAVPALFANPYGRSGAGDGAGVATREAAPGPDGETPRARLDPHRPAPAVVPIESRHDWADMVQEARRYGALVLDLAKDAEFDVIHAHDWMTFPAGMAIAAHTGKPLVVHIHSTEFDRSGRHVDQRVYDIERRGMHAATTVIAVSHLTKSVLVHRYAVPAAKIEVVYNGVVTGADPAGAAVAPAPPADRAGIDKSDKIVLFLGRITMQKGPEYFVAAAKKVLEKYDRVKFVMAGTGDKTKDVIELAAREGVGHKVLFTGFLRGHDVERIFSMADVYVMPSVSEPFGISALEAVSQNVPVIISKQSGVGEVLRHALKVDFWDIEEMANKIIGVLRHPPLAQTMREHADMEVRRLTWEDAAARCRRIYEAAAGVEESRG